MGNFTSSSLASWSFKLGPTTMVEGGPSWPTLPWTPDGHLSTLWDNLNAKWILFNPNFKTYRSRCQTKSSLTNDSPFLSPLFSNLTHRQWGKSSARSSEHSGPKLSSAGRSTALGFVQQWGRMAQLRFQSWTILGMLKAYGNPIQTTRNVYNKRRA